MRQVIEIEDTFQLEVSAKFSPVVPATQHSPPEGGEVYGIQVKIYLGKSWIDITEHLDAQTLAIYIQRLREDGDHE